MERSDCIRFQQPTILLGVRESVFYRLLTGISRFQWPDSSVDDYDLEELLEKAARCASRLAHSDAIRSPNTPCPLREELAASHRAARQLQAQRHAAAAAAAAAATAEAAAAVTPAEPNNNNSEAVASTTSGDNKKTTSEGDFAAAAVTAAAPSTSGEGGATTTATPEDAGEDGAPATAGTASASSGEDGASATGAAPTSSGGSGATAPGAPTSSAENAATAAPPTAPNADASFTSGANFTTRNFNYFSIPSTEEAAATAAAMASSGATGGTKFCNTITPTETFIRAAVEDFGFDTDFAENLMTGVLDITEGRSTRYVFTANGQRRQRPGRVEREDGIRAQRRKAWECLDKAVQKALSVIQYQKVDCFIHLFIHSFIHSFIHLFFYSFVSTFIHSFICSFIHLFVPLFFLQAHCSNPSSHALMNSLVTNLRVGLAQLFVNDAYFLV